MRIIFEDGTSQECSPADQRYISVDNVIIAPQGAAPTHLALVWDNPPTYTRLGVMGCDKIAPNQWVMTPEGLKRVVEVEQEW